MFRRFSIAYNNNNNNNHFTTLCSGLPGWACIRRNIHLLTTIKIINHPLSASSIYYDPQHPLSCSIYVPDSLLHNLFQSPLWSTSWSRTPTSYSIHFFTRSLSSFCNTCPYHRDLSCCSSEIMPSIASLSLNSLLRTLSFTLMSHIHLTILISARWSATSFSFLTGYISLLCNIPPLIINDISILVSNGTNCLNLFHPIRILASTAVSAPRTVTVESQHVMNAAACVVTDNWKFDRGLGEILHDDLDWLDVPNQAFLKLAVTVHQCLNGRAPPYLSDYCVPVATADTRRHLCSTNRQLLQYLTTSSTLTAIVPFHMPFSQPETLSWISSGARQSVQTVSDIC